MKKSVLFSIMVLLSAYSYAQTDYQPMVREGVKWVFLNSDVAIDDDYEGEDLKFVGKGDFPFYLEFKGDTTINGLTYKKLYCSLSREYDAGKLRPVAYLREEDKCVYGISDPVGCDQYKADYNLPLHLYSMAMYGTTPWREYKLYDFVDIEAFARNVFSLIGYEDADVNVVNETVKVGGENRNAYHVQIAMNGEVYEDLTIVEGIGCLDYMLGFTSTIVPTCICPRSLGLAQQETSAGDIIYRGTSYYGPYNGHELIDVDDVNHAINIILGKQLYSRHFLNDISDFNGDYVVDVDDVNSLINYILNK